MPPRPRPPRGRPLTSLARHSHGHACTEERKRGRGARGATSPSASLRGLAGHAAPGTVSVTEGCLTELRGTRVCVSAGEGICSPTAAASRAFPEAQGARRLAVVLGPAAVVPRAGGCVCVWTAHGSAGRRPRRCGGVRPSNARRDAGAGADGTRQRSPGEGAEPGPGPDGARAAPGPCVRRRRPSARSAAPL